MSRSVRGSCRAGRSESDRLPRRLSWRVAELEATEALSESEAIDFYFNF